MSWIIPLFAYLPPGDETQPIIGSGFVSVSVSEPAMGLTITFQDGNYELFVNDENSSLSMTFDGDYDQVIIPVPTTLTDTFGTVAYDDFDGDYDETIFSTTESDTSSVTYDDFDGSYDQIIVTSSTQTDTGSVIVDDFDGDYDEIVLATVQTDTFSAVAYDDFDGSYDAV